jgi:hypothetical protein
MLISLRSDDTDSDGGPPALGALTASYGVEHPLLKPQNGTWLMAAVRHKQAVRLHNLSLLDPISKVLSISDY